jgi:hypothetical protein
MARLPDGAPKARALAIQKIDEAFGFVMPL